MRTCYFVGFVTMRLHYATRTLLLEALGVWGIWGEWLFIFRKLDSTGNYFQEFREHAHSFGDLGSPAKKQKKSHLKGKAFISFDLNFGSGGGGGSPPDPL